MARPTNHFVAALSAKSIRTEDAFDIAEIDVPVAIHVCRSAAHGATALRLDVATIEDQRRVAEVHAGPAIEVVVAPRARLDLFTALGRITDLDIVAITSDLQEGKRSA